MAAGAPAMGRSAATDTSIHAACMDAGRRIAVGGAITVEAEGQGHMQFFRYSETGDLSAWITAEGGTLNNGPMATSVVCH